MAVKAAHTPSVTACLTRLLPHLERGHVAIAGSVAIALQLSARRLSVLRDAADVDLVAASLDAVAPGVTAEFLVSHCHTPSAGHPKFLLQLVHPASRTRVDVFPDLTGSLGRAALLDIAGVRFGVLTLEDILDHKLATLAGASDERPAAEKHYRDAVMLATLCGRTVPAPPALSMHEEFSCDLDARCPRCEAGRLAAFPLAHKQAVFDVLGYV